MNPSNGTPELPAALAAAVIDYGKLANNNEMVSSLQSCVSGGEQVGRIIPRLLNRVIDEGAWLDRRDQDGRRFTFDRRAFLEFLTAPAGRSRRRIEECSRGLHHPDYGGSKLMRRFERKPRQVQGVLFADIPAPSDPGPPAIIPLDFESYAVRTTQIAGGDYWYGVDVCRAIGLDQNPSQSYSRLDDDEKLTLINHDGQGGARSFVLLNESGVFSLILTSSKPAARRFKRWLTHEVLPSLRRTGTYTIKLDTRVARTARAPRCDVHTAEERVENRDVNRARDDSPYGGGGGACHDSRWHDAGYRGQFGKDAGQLRKLLGIKGKGTPLDRMGGLVLAQNSHAKELAIRQARARSDDVTAQVHNDLLEQAAREIAAADFTKLPEGSHYGAVDDPTRGKILDVVTPRPAGPGAG